MFGFVQAASSVLSEEEEARYRELYCGLCFALKERYGQLSRFCLTYDLTFYVMLCNSLFEPPEEAGEGHCLAQVGKRVPYAKSRFADYAADLSVAFAYHKLLDDWIDDRNVAARAELLALKGSYERARERIPEQCAAIERSLERIGHIERSVDAGPDDAALEFGALLGELFSWTQGIWTDQMRALGMHLGRFVYFMDAAVDYSDDVESGSYNPFRGLDATPESMRTLLSAIAADVAAVFEKLPLEQDLHILRSVLYSGLWLKFNETYA